MQTATIIEERHATEAEWKEIARQLRARHPQSADALEATGKSFVRDGVRLLRPRGLAIRTPDQIVKVSAPHVHVEREQPSTDLFADEPDLIRQRAAYVDDGGEPDLMKLAATGRIRAADGEPDLFARAAEQATERTITRADLVAQLIDADDRI